jgi:hypothetical protein
MSLNMSKNNSDLTFENDSSHQNETCDRHENIALIMTLLFLTGFVLNFALLALIYRSREVKETRNLYFIGLLVLNIINGLMDFPLFIIRNFTCK